MNDKYEGARANAKGWYETIKEQVEAVQGWEKAAHDAGWEPFKDSYGVACWCDNLDGTMFAGTAEQLCEYHVLQVDENEDARRELEEGPLSVMVRDGWRSPGGEVGPNPEPAEEFEILLSTGGPALRIWGTLSHGEPDECELQMQDWGTPWTKWTPEPYDPEYRNTLRAYASCFYFRD